MSSSRGGRSSSSSNNNGGGVQQSIPAASRKMVQSLKEIVNCPEHEIYSTLKDCNMDPNEAVNRLLSQDPFHEVKSKREKKKENKDTTETRSRGVSTSNHGGRGATDHYGGRSSNQFGASVFEKTDYGKPAYKKENGTNSFPTSLSSVAGMAGSSTHRRPPVSSDAITSDNKWSTTGTLDGISSSSPQSSTGYQAAWLGVPGQVSMADIVKMGRPHGKASSPNLSHPGVHNHHVQAAPFPPLQNNLPSSLGHAAKVSEMNSEPRNISPSVEWSLVEHPPASSGPFLQDPAADSEIRADQSNLHCDRINQQPRSYTDEVRAAGDGSVENFDSNHVGHASVSGRKMREDTFGGSFFMDTELGSYQSHGHPSEHQYFEDAGGSESSVTAHLHQLSVQEDSGASPAEDLPSVVIPNHLQVQTADCLHLSFGSFGAGTSASFSGPFPSRESKSNLEEESVEETDSSIGHSDTRNAEYYGDEPLRTSPDGNLVHMAGASAGSYESPSASQPEDLKQENLDEAHANHNAFPSSTPGYTFENSQQLNTGFTHSQTSPQMQNLAPFSSVMAYTNSLPSTLLAATVQSVRESDPPYSPFPMAQSLPTKYSHTVSSVNGSSISMPEALKAANFLSNQPTPQTLAGTSVATGPALPQHLAVHPYSQPTLPLGPFANMIGYPFLPQSYTYMPSAFQQTFAGNSTYHQSLAAVLPQYKNSATVSSLPQSANVPSGYGAFGSSTSIPGNFPMNPSTAPSGTTMGYDDILNTQYKDSSHLISLHQNENSPMWVHGPGSRTISAIPANTYYSFQGQNQQPSGFRQGQQPSQNYGVLGYPNFYHAQTGVSLEHQQQQNPRDGSLGGGGSQGQQPSKQSPQIWQSSY